MYMAKKQLIRLTEGDLHNIIKESVNNILTELDWKTYANAAKKRYQQYKENPKDTTSWDSAYKLNRTANERFDDDYVGDMKYDTLGDKIRGKKSPKFYSHFDSRSENMPQQAIKGTNRSGDEIFNTKRGSYFGSKPVGGGYVNPNNFFKDKEVGEKFKSASDELWDYHDGNYEYQKGEGWKKKMTNESRYSNATFRQRFSINGINCYQYGCFYDGCAIVINDNDGWNYMNEEGELISKKIWFNCCHDFINGWGCVYRKDMGYNFINANGQFLYDKWLPFVEHDENWRLTPYKEDVENFYKNH